MPLLSTSELAAMRVTQETALPDTCTIQTASVAVNEGGGPVETWADTYTNVPCRLAYVSGVSVGTSGGVGIAGSKLIAAQSPVLSVPHDQDITAQMRVVKGGVTYKVTNVNEGASYLTVKRAQLERL